MRALIINCYLKFYHLIMEIPANELYCFHTVECFFQNVDENNKI
jgi:hypothetical protein